MRFTTTLFFSCLLLFMAASISSAQDLVRSGADWKYLDDGSDQGVAWRDPFFSDTGWKSVKGSALRSGRGVLAVNKPVTYYFRHTFQVSDSDEIGGLVLRLKRSGGAVVYLNGKEVLRSNLPEGNIYYSTPALSAGEATDSTSISPDALVNGTNTLAVELHQDAAGAASPTFEFALAADDLKITRGPYLQMITPESVLIRWRTSVPTDSRIYWSADAANQDQTVDEAASTTEHSIVLSGLSNNIQYYYRVGNSNGLIKKKRFTFWAPPDNGHPHPSRIWVLGDIGGQRSVAKPVVKAYKSFNNKYTNVILFLGDNAYEQGTDEEYQSFFKTMKKMLPGSIMASALGERDTAGSTNPPSTLPYFQNFNPPNTDGGGGVASGTEKYYSFNYGIIHFIVLDSMASGRGWTSTMLNWLRDDMDNNHRPWTIALWHHSPYSKGNHDSDQEIEMIEMRQNATRILENRGVDLIIGGHSNSYERSYMLNGFYGMSSTFSPSMVFDGGDGKPGGDGAYTKAAGSVDSGTVYVTLGSSGVNPTPVALHPAMYAARSQSGSVVVDVVCNNLTLQFLTASGTVSDNFAIEKTNIKPSVNVTNPDNGATFNGPLNLTVSANTDDPDSRIRKVQFSQNGKFIGADYSPPYSVQWNNVAPGSYSITAVAEDDLCGSTTSTPVNITVN